MRRKLADSRSARICSFQVNAGGESMARCYVESIK